MASQRDDTFQLNYSDLKFEVGLFFGEKITKTNLSKSPSLENSQL